MRNQRNCIPVPTKPVKGSPKPLPRVLVQRKSCSCQTERVVLVKEENLSFHSRFAQNDGGMRRDYVKAVNYINSCHKFINTIIEKNSDSKSVFLLPMVTDFVPIFPLLTGRKKKEKVVEKVEKKVSKSEERKSKSNFAVKKPPQEAPVDPLPVGDCGNVQDTQEDKYTIQLADIVKDQIQHFLSTLQEDMNKAMKKTKSEIPKQKCKNLNIVKQRLEELTKICFLQKNIESNQKIVQLVSPQIPPTPPPMNTSEECSVILSDTDCEEQKITQTRISHSSLVSESSDIKSDSDLEIHV